MTQCCAVRCAVALLFFTCVVFCADNYVVVSKDVARVVLLPYGDAKLVGMAKKGDLCRIISKKGDWYNIEFKGSIGWIYQANVATPESAVFPASSAVSTQLQQSSLQSRQATQPVQAAPAPKPPAGAQGILPETSRQQSAVEQPGLLLEEKQEGNLEQGQKRGQRKQKKPQNVAVDLPPASVMPMTSSKQPSPYSSSETAAVSPLPSQAAPPGSKTPGQTAQKYFEITESPARILVTVSPESPILGMAHNNECYPLLYVGTSWCKIQFGKNPGWVDRRYGRIVDAPTATKEISRIVLFSALGGVGLVLLALLVIVAVISLRSKATRKVAVKKDLLIIAKAEKEIQYSLTNATTTLAKCFSEIGFQISYATDLDHARNLLAHYLPDIIVVDWQIGDNVVSAVESVLVNRSSTSNILAVFYNVPDTAAVARHKAQPNVHFLGIAFSDRDIFRLVTPLIITQTETKSIRKSVETSALGGEIGPGSLIEVMQFIEIGRKTGCLYVVTDKPFGLIYFEQGRLVYAATPSQQGRNAVYEMLDLSKGHFHFVLDKTTQTRNVDLSTLEILMEWTKTVDEAHRN